MKRILKYCLIFLFVASLGILTGCNKKSVKSFNKDMNASMKSVKEVVSTTSMTDQEVLVFQYEKHVTIYDTNVLVEETTKELDSSFNLASSSESTTLDSVSKSDLFSLNLTKSNVKGFSYSSTKASFDVEAKSIGSVMNGSNDLVISGKAHFEFTISSGKCMNYTITYVTESNRSVTVVVQYIY